MLDRSSALRVLLRSMVVSGMTDLQIVEEALRGEGITREHIYAAQGRIAALLYRRDETRGWRLARTSSKPIPGGREV